MITSKIIHDHLIEQIPMDIFQATKLRIGKLGDGGYILLEDYFNQLNNTKVVYSLGL